MLNGQDPLRLETLSQEQVILKRPQILEIAPSSFHPLEKTVPAPGSLWAGLGVFFNAVLDFPWQRKKEPASSLLDVKIHAEWFSRGRIY